MRRLLLVLALGLVLPATAGAQVRPERVIPPGARAAGLEVGGLTLSAAAAKLEAAFAARLAEPIHVRVARYRRTLRPGAARFAFDAPRTALRAYKRARKVPPEADGTRPVDVPLAVTYNWERVREFARAVDRRTHIGPRSARIRLGLRRIGLRRAKIGRSVNAAALVVAVRERLEDPDARRVFRFWRAHVHPRVHTRELRRQYRTVITIDRANFRLRLFKRLRYVKRYGIAVGAPGFSTPAGRFSITNKAVNPAWSAPDQPWAGAYRNEVVAGGSAENPLKARWLGIVGGVGIHGTAAEYSIGTQASHGCIRMRVADVIDLYPRVPVGTPVLIR
jgi:lipoprotein-anchoring transpeptidase ErfK/SrfK